ncbi:hypothetical protein HMPREF0208_03390 [Citrobacter koseri]|nr:hypothetical protein HMPREF3207_01761 [Citrobacter koseri]KXA03852.1 hypothetical protein HMPREF3220_00459 [Citrobacter koseri]KXB41860.1 hypothetical protein HMPREF0208_03390 [Citrobacter koseri]
MNSFSPRFVNGLMMYVSIMLDVLITRIKGLEAQSYFHRNKKQTTILLHRK